MVPYRERTKATTMKRRNRFKQTTSLSYRLIQLAQAARTRAASLPPGEERDRFLRKAYEADRALQMEELLSTAAGVMPL
ncbi:hypothetical protein [Bradyrhizobium sp. th.b2]|uniref:hypothetical protein n=1 Tax=Bradyrhizobium sp. th-b2 TaxID=172088 RepID=UPI0004060C2D|nr:hypothetical protein [Bradyrhizobium sp. th.b2]